MKDTEKTQRMKTINKLVARLFLAVFSFILANTVWADTSADTNVIALEESGHSSEQKNHKENGEYVRKRFLRLMKKPFDTKDSRTRILIIGDSHAQDFLNAIAENRLLKNSQIRTRYIPTRCQIYLGNSASKEIHENDVSLCNQSDSLESAKAQIAEADIIIFSALWRMWAVKALPKTISNLGLSPEQKLYVIGRRSFLKPNKEQLHDLSKGQQQSLRSAVDIHQQAINTAMAKVLDEQTFVDVHFWVCGREASCPVFTDNMKLISFDGGHLSKDGAHYLGRILFNKSQLAALINPD
jgi:hypothetical protein